MSLAEYHETTSRLAEWLRKKAEYREERIKAAIIKANGGQMPTREEVATRAQRKTYNDLRSEWYWDGKLVLVENQTGEFFEP